jgi:hypothetical protein
MSKVGEKWLFVSYQAICNARWCSPSILHAPRYLACMLVVCQLLLVLHVQAPLTVWSCLLCL